ncbi:Protein argonaute-2 [Porphyridium purpureum]|uniref:Protein argonaute-2 n=1 Tax=Porphyridium purpureum TaxID=35688 RepID=A0A5J4YLN3_PORPP|nr:Protein argonaute-2 [Porphyridium purpureum]|eukprot:POR9176..scf295_9
MRVGNGGGRGARRVREVAGMATLLHRLDAPNQGIGAAGTPLHTVYANAYKLTPRNVDVDLVQYDVEIVAADRDSAPRMDLERKNQGINRRIITELQNQHPAVFHRDSGGTLAAYDAQKILVTSKGLMLPGDPDDAAELDVVMTRDGQPDSTERFRVKLKLTAVRSLKDLMDWFQNSRAPIPTDVLMCLDQIARQTPTSTMTMAGRNFFNPNSANVGRLHGGFHVWRGCFWACPEANPSVAEYLRTAYGIVIKFADFPCLEVKRGSRVLHIPMELATFGPGAQRRPGKITPRQTADLIRVAAVKPRDRMRALNDIMRDLNLSEDPNLGGLFECDRGPLRIPRARLLDVPDVMYANNATMRPRDGAWNIANSRLLESGATQEEPFQHYGVVVGGSDREMPMYRVMDFFRLMVQTAQNSAFALSPLDPALVLHVPERNITGGMRQVFQMVFQAKGSCSCIFVISLSGTAEVYNRVKLDGDTQLGVVTQVLRKRTVDQPKAQTCANIVLKLNVKIGLRGKNHAVKPPSGSLANDFENRPFMICGADVTHPAAGDRRETATSISALVGTIDRKMTRYVGELRPHPQGEARQEKISEIGSMIQRLLMMFQNMNSMLPEAIVLFRDGLSEGQYNDVVGSELQNLRRGCQAMKEGYAPRITYVVVTKRHRFRLFAEDSREVDRNSNVRPGTVVDTGITNPALFEFYLASSMALQGTSKPARYTVLYDDMGFTPDQMQNLAYRLCYSYSRCTRSVSIPTPVYYAHHLAFRGRAYVSDDTDSSSDPSRSGAASGGSGGIPFPDVHFNLKQRMFYC